jgi:hypothetical protein
VSEAAQTPNEVRRVPPARPRLSAEGVAVLHAALERALTSRSAKSSSAVRHAIWRICIDARRNSWPPEWLLVAFKTAVYSLPSVRRLPGGPDRDEFVGHLVSLCINEYYGPSAMDPDAGDGSVPRGPIYGQESA